MNMQAWLSQLCQMLPGIKQAILVTDFASDSDSYLHWPKGSANNDDLRTAVKLARNQQQTVTTTTSSSQVPSDEDIIIAYPLTHNDALYGVVAIQISIKPQQQPIVMQILRWGESWLQLFLQQGIEESCLPVINALNCAYADQSNDSRAQAITTVLANDLHCDRVTIGLLDGVKIRVKAISFNTRFDSRVALIQYIELAMAETYQQQTTILVATQNTNDSDNNIAHLQLAEKEADSYTCSVPIAMADTVIGVILLERKNDQPFEPEVVQHCEVLGKLLAPLFSQQGHPGRQGNHFAKGIMSPLRGFFQKEGKRVKYAVTAAIVVVALLLVLPATYRVSAPAAIEGRIQRVIVAPFEGYIEDAFYRAGEIVTLGKLIAKMDTKELLLEQQRLQGQKSEYVKQYRSALSKSDKAQSYIYKSQVVQADAQLQLVNNKIQRSRLTSPLDGVIISGDLSRSLGSPVKRGDVLFQVAPLDEYRLIVFVDETEIAHVEKGMKGELTLKALPDDDMKFTVNKVSPVFNEKGGEISYRVEAAIDEESPALRPGMQGVAKVEIGDRRRGWIYFHKLFDAIKLWFLSWSP